MYSIFWVQVTATRKPAEEMSSKTGLLVSAVQLVAMVREFFFLSDSTVVGFSLVCARAGQVLITSLTSKMT